MSQRQPSSTLYATELSWRPLVLRCLVGCALAAVVLLAVTFGAVTEPLWLACTALAAALTCSNVHYLRTHTSTTVGMLPVSLASLAPVALTVTLDAQLPLTLRATAVVLLAACAGVIALFALWFIRLRRCYEAHPQLADDAVLIVLGGAIKQGRPCQTLARRLDVAARLWHEAPTRTIVPTGGPVPRSTLTEAAAMTSYLVEQGVDPAAILPEHTARNTRQNILCSCELLDARGLGGQRCVVSSDYHLWRARGYGRTLGISLTAVAAPTPRGSWLQQWCREVITILFERR